MAAEGYFHVSRKMFDGHDPFWREKRVFSRAEAWIDVVQMAAYKPHQKMVGGHIEMIARGEFLASERFLATRWTWGRTRVRAFLGLLQKLNRIRPSRETSNGTSYLLVNYESYQNWQTSNDTSSDTSSVPPPNQERTTSEPKRSKEIEGNKRNEGKELKPLSAKNADDAAVRAVFDHFNQKRGGRRPLRLLPDYRNKIAARLRTFTVADLNRAADTALADSFYRGDNDRSKRFDFPDIVFKNDAAVERHLSRAEPTPREDAFRKRYAEKMAADDAAKANAATPEQIREAMGRTAASMKLNGGSA